MRRQGLGLGVRTCVRPSVTWLIVTVVMPSGREKADERLVYSLERTLTIEHDVYARAIDAVVRAHAGVVPARAGGR